MSTKINRYDNPVYNDNIYGHALSLLKRYDGGEGVHLDFGCGYGRVAEHIVEETGLTYIGLDIDDVALASLQGRGFEACQLDIRDTNKVQDIIAAKVNGRKIASMSALNVLEHIEDPRPILNHLRQLATDFGSLLILGVPNITHRDVGFKLAFGRWDYTNIGLLEDDHIRFYSDSFLTKLTRACGWHEVSEKDTSLTRTEQAFPSSHPALSQGTPLRQVLTMLREQTDQNGEKLEFVRAYLPGPIIGSELLSTEVPVIETRPFLSVIMRTQGRRPETMRDALLALTSQSDTDFEVIIIPHKVDEKQQLLVERVVDDLPEWIRSKISIRRLNTGNRTTPLNYGFSLAVGDYISILDDDDLPFAHWVETFRTLSKNHQGRILRAIAVRQDSKWVYPTLGSRAVEFISSPTPYPATFNWIEHLNCNASPPISLAFPRGAFHDLGYRFDESLSTTEDWDFLMRVFLTCGVASVCEVTSIYRWWIGAENSQTVHNADEWNRNQQRIFQKMDNSPALLQAGNLGDVRRLYLRALSMDPAILKTLDREHYSDEALILQKQLRKIIRSSSWKLTSPVRSVQRIFGIKKIKINLRETNTDRLRDQIRVIHRSLSWRLTRPLRMLTGGRSYG